MRAISKQLTVSVCSVLALGVIHNAAADTSSDTEILLNWAERTYPQYFPTHQVTQTINPWLYRYYPETGIYAGVNSGDTSAYVLGGPWGESPARIDTLASLIAQITNSGGNGSVPACNAANAPAGLFYTQNGNVVNVTTNGQCIPLPSSNNLCQAPPQTAATGISVLTSTSVNSSKFDGISINIPGIPNPFESFGNQFSNSKFCTINTPTEGINLTVVSDVCFDMTAQFEGQLEDITGVVVTPPITMATKSTTTSQQVSDCFATDADSVFDALTNEFWIKQNGTFVKQSS